jgi:hypothetical protein
MMITLAERRIHLECYSHEGTAQIDTSSPVMHIASQVGIQAIRHEDADKIVDLAQRQVDKEQMCHHANMVRKDQCPVLPKLSGLSTETEAAGMSAVSMRNDVALCCNVAEASGSEPNPSRETK